MEKESQRRRKMEMEIRKAKIAVKEI